MGKKHRGPALKAGPSSRAGARPAPAVTTGPNGVPKEVEPVRDTVEGAVLLRELVAFFGWQEAARLIGTLFLLTLQGKDGKIVDQEGPEYTTQWRARKEMQRFSKYLQARGFLLGAASGADELGRRVAQLRGDLA